MLRKIFRISFKRARVQFIVFGNFFLLFGLLILGEKVFASRFSLCVCAFVRACPFLAFKAECE